MGRDHVLKGTTRVLALLMLLQTPVHAQDSAAQQIPVISEFIGTWKGQGNLLGSEATFSMKWEWVLGQRFVRLTFENRMQGPDGVERVLQAQAFYRPVGEGRLEGTWFDSRGMVLPLVGSSEQTTLTTLWGTPATEEGRTVYRLLDEGLIEVKDFVLKGDQWQKFGQALYRRVASNR